MPPRRAAQQPQFRKFTRKDVAVAHRLSVAVGWPHRVQDWLFARALGAGFVAEDRGDIVGSILYWKHDRHAASIGMVIVAPERQGEGIGRRLMQLALGALDGRTVYLNATPAGRALYERFGFRTVREVDQHHGAVGNVVPVALDRGVRLRPVGKSDAPHLAELASRASGFSRAKVVQGLLEFADGIVLDRGGEARGFALLRRFGHGRLIGPVIAPDVQGARALVAYLAASNRGLFLRIDVDAAAGLAQWLGELGLRRVDRVETMARGEALIPGENMRVFALVNQALG